MRIWILFLPLLTFGCSQAAKEKVDELIESGKIVPVPVVANVQYFLNGEEVTQNVPISSALEFIADPGTGSCTLDQIRIKVIGTIELPKAVGIEVLGARSVETSIEDDSFVSTVCLAAGATALKIRAISESNNKSENFNLSISANPGLATIARGHPSYPNPGFRANSSRLSGVTQSQSITLENVSVEATRNQSFASSTGDSSYSFETGYLNILRQSK